MTRLARARFAAAPAEGWISLLLVAVMAVAVAWAIDDSALVLGQRSWTDFLPWVSLGGVGAGFLGARARWNRPIAHIVGAGFAAIIVPLIAGTILDPTGSPTAQFQATAASSVNAVLDFAWRGLPLTRETGHYLVVLGLLCWANGQFAASSVFRHGRPIGPIIVLGTVLVANMSATSRSPDQIWFLVQFSMASLFLLTRLHTLDERATWIRRRIGDPSTVGSLYLRGGTVFIVAAIFSSLALTATARSAPLAGYWDDARPALVDISQWLQRIIPAAPDARSVGVPSFGQQVTVGGTWSSSDEPALEIFRKTADDRPLYWRATTYDKFTMFGWASTDPVEERRPAGTDLLGSTVDAIPATSRRTTETFRIVPKTNLFKVAFSPVDPASISIDSTLTTSGDAGFFQSLAIPARTPYTVTTSLQELADVDGGVTQNRLRAAGTDYPDEVLARYLGVPVGSLGPSAKLVLGDIKAALKAAGKSTPFDVAATMVTYLRDPGNFQYNTKIPGVCDKDPSIVECFAAHRTGFCEYYASTMAILLRELKIPARLAEGFLPGAIDVATGRETIAAGGAHAWVEVYFPGTGWFPFDPTGGGRARSEDILSGSVQPIPSPKPSPSFGRSSGDPRDGPDAPGSNRPTSGGIIIGGGGGPNTPAFILISVLLLAAIILAAFLAWRRGPRGATTPEGVYASIAGLARRFGFGPRPTQTTFEYAAALGDVLPGVRPELHTVATAQVEVAYGRRELGDDRLTALRDSYRKLRVGLLRLAFRRSDRRRMR